MQGKGDNFASPSREGCPPAKCRCTFVVHNDHKAASGTTGNKEPPTAGHGTPGAEKPKKDLKKDDKKDLKKDDKKDLKKDDNKDDKDTKKDLKKDDKDTKKDLKKDDNKDTKDTKKDDNKDTKKDDKGKRLLPGTALVVPPRCYRCSDTNQPRMVREPIRQNELRGKSRSHA